MADSGVSLMSKLYFYHSFPRYKDDRLALGILHSILNRGLLITSEERKLPRTGKLPAVPFIQQRLCFTLIEPTDLRRHARHFGQFSLEFEPDKLRSFGAQPVLYLAGALPKGKLLNKAGNEVARHMLETHNVLRTFWKLRESKDRKIVAAAAKIMAAIHPTQHSFETFFFTLQILLNLYYPTDRKVTAPLHFFRQREWRIIPNFSHDGTWHYPKIEPPERDELLKLNPYFFKAQVGGKPRIDSCLLFSRIGHHHIVKEARRIIVPDRYVAETKRMVSEAKLSLRVAALSSVK